MLSSFCRVCAAVCLLAALGACASKPDDSISSVSLTGDLATPFQIEVENFVRRQPPAIYVQPRAPLGHRPRALFVPLRAVQKIGDAVTFSDMLSRQIWQIWLSQHGFQTLEYAPQNGPFDLNRALALARRKGAEVLVSGYINHYMDGGDGGESSVSLNMEIYDVRTGTLLWSLAQGGLMEPRDTHDFYLFSIRERNPLDPTGLITRTLAWDMGNVVLGWADASRVQTVESPLLDRIMGKQGF